MTSAHKDLYTARGALTLCGICKSSGQMQAAVDNRRVAPVARLRAESACYAGNCSYQNPLPMNHRSSRCLRHWLLQRGP